MLIERCTRGQQQFSKFDWKIQDETLEDQKKKWNGRNVEQSDLIGQTY
jgi:hypothetical protein